MVFLFLFKTCGMSKSLEASSQRAKFSSSRNSFLSLFLRTCWKSYSFDLVDDIVLWSLIYWMWLQRLVLWVNFSADGVLKYFSYFSKKTDFAICMKCQILFSGKNKKNITNSSSDELDLRVVKVNFRLSVNACNSYFQAQRLTQCPMGILTKAAPTLSEDNFIDIMPVAWELMLESDQELAAAAGKWARRKPVFRHTVINLSHTSRLDVQLTLYLDFAYLK